MKKIIINFLLISFLLSGIFLIILSIYGIETEKFNRLISNKVNEANNNTRVKFNKINFKLDIDEISLFLETTNPQINYRGAEIPTKYVKVYLDFISLIKTSPKIKKIKVGLNELNFNQVKKLSFIIKPSNFKNIITNNINSGNLISEFEIYLDENNSPKNFIAKGSVNNLSIQLKKDFDFKNTKFDFFADKSDILIKNIFGKLEDLEIKEGDLRISVSPVLTLKSNFLTNIRIKNKLKKLYLDYLPNYEILNDSLSFDANLNNYLQINFDDTYKIKNYSFDSNGEILKAKLKFKKPFNNPFLKNRIKEISISNSQIKTFHSSKKKSIEIAGKYSLNGKNFLNYEIKTKNEKKELNLNLDIEYNDDLSLDIINYKKNQGSIANFSLNFHKHKEKIIFKKIDLSEKNNKILLEDLKLINNKVISFKKFSARTYDDGKKNNDFSIFFDKKIKIIGSEFDGTNIPKFINQKGNKTNISKISKEIEIDLKSIKAPLSENLKNFKLIGFLDTGRFSKINAKGDFGGNKFLDISMKNDKKNEKKYLEIYSDLPRPLLTQFDFFEGLSGGKLLYTSIIKNNNSSSKLKIENFKVVKAPGVVKLLSLADLGGLADLAKGEGLSFDFLEINMEKNDDLLNLNEIYAIGPSISVLMDGYQDKNGLTSLRGTLVPAKNLNKFLSKIPVLGEIIIPKEVGEGFFGISFKMKGTKGKIKTTINPIKTLTPRFIQKIIEKNRNIK